MRKVRGLGGACGDSTLLMAVDSTETSLPSRSGALKPMPLTASHHLTVPLSIAASRAAHGCIKQ